MAIAVAAASTRPAAGWPVWPAARALHEELRALAADRQLAGADQVRGSEHPGVVAFTFDDGPHRDTTPVVIDALLRYDVPATFFIVTKRLTDEASRQLIERQLAAGFTVGSHTVSHRNLRRARPAEMVDQIDSSLRSLAMVAGRPIGLFRPPFGAMSDRARAHLTERGMTEVRWSIDPRDWDAAPENAAALRAETLTMILRAGGGIVLLHDVKAVTAGIIAPLLDDLEAENCRRLASADGLTPIIPVSLHYFLRDRQQPRAVPREVEARTAAYRAGLPARCAARAEPER